MTNEPRFRSVARAAIYEQVADQIRGAILDRSLSSGDHLPPERELARQFGVSRATVREALRHLQAQGLLAPRGRTSPMQTATPDEAVMRFCESLTHAVRLRDVSLPDLVALRLAIEGAALAHAAAAPSEEHLETARAALVVMERPRVSVVDFHRADVDFHAALVAASGNQAFTLVLLAVRDSIELHLAELLKSRSFAGLRASVVEEHRAILRAVERRDPVAVSKLVSKHITGFYGT